MNNPTPEEVKAHMRTIEQRYDRTALDKLAKEIFPVKKSYGVMPYNPALEGELSK